VLWDGYLVYDGLPVPEHHYLLVPDDPKALNGKLLVARPKV
jgi:hypothetical protein